MEYNERVSISKRFTIEGRDIEIANGENNGTCEIDLSGRSDSSGGKLGDKVSHRHLWAVVTIRPSDFEPYGFRKREGEADCSCGCKWFLPLGDRYRYDWGICANPISPRVGLLTYEHMGCPFFEMDDIDDIEI